MTEREKRMVARLTGRIVRAALEGCMHTQIMPTPGTIDDLEKICQEGAAEFLDELPTDPEPDLDPSEIVRSYNQLKIAKMN